PCGYAPGQVDTPPQRGRVRHRSQRPSPARPPPKHTMDLARSYARRPSAVLTLSGDPSEANGLRKHIRPPHRHELDTLARRRSMQPHTVTCVDRNVVDTRRGPVVAVEEQVTRLHLA